MLEVSFLACSLLTGQKCQDIHIVLLPDVTMMQCATFGQQAIGEWVRNNDFKWSVSGGYTCGKVGSYAKI